MRMSVKISFTSGSINRLLEIRLLEIRRHTQMDRGTVGTPL